MMSLQPYLPPSSAEAGTISALLQVISDPKAAKAALEKMMEHQKEIENATAKQQEMFKHQQEQLSKERVENEKLKRTADMIAAKAASEMNTSKAMLEDAHRRQDETIHMEKRTAELRVGLEERDKRLKEQEAEMAHRWTALQAREAAVNKNELTLVKREDDLTIREKTLADDIAENTRWLAGLRPPRTR